MKRVALCLVIISLVLATVWVTDTPPEPDIPPVVSIADLQTNSTHYQDKLISVRGVVINEQSGNALLIGASSAQRIPIYVEGHTVLSALPEWVGYWSFCANDDKANMARGLSADMLITGTFDGTALIPTAALVLSRPTKHLSADSAD